MQRQAEAGPQGLYLKVYHQDQGFRTGWLFSCLMFRPAERALSCSDLCPREPKYPSHRIMWSGCRSLSETEACRTLGLVTAEWGRAGAIAGDNGDWGLCNSGSCPPLGSFPLTFPDWTTQWNCGNAQCKQLFQGLLCFCWKPCFQMGGVVEGRGVLV